LIWEVAVEQYSLSLRPQPSKEWDASRELINDESIGAKGVELSGEDRDGEDKV